MLILLYSRAKISICTVTESDTVQYVPLSSLVVLINIVQLYEKKNQSRLLTLLVQISVLIYQTYYFISPQMTKYIHVQCTNKIITLHDTNSTHFNCMHLSFKIIKSYKI
jgi:hypothetical protein